MLQSLILSLVLANLANVSVGAEKTMQELHDQAVMLQSNTTRRRRRKGSRPPASEPESVFNISGGTFDVYILAGQSNMQGRGLTAGKGPGTLQDLCKDSKTKAIIGQACDGKKFNKVDNVNVWMSQKNCGQASSTCDPWQNKEGKLGPGFGYSSKLIGPELGFGFAMKNADPARQILILKVAFGGSTLAKNWRPPSSAVEAEDEFCPDRRKCTDKWNCYCDSPQTVGENYNYLLEFVDKALNDRERLWKKFKDLGGLTPVIKGFGWVQGWSDGIEPCAAGAYGTNLVNLIQDLRAAWKLPNLPVVINIAGFHALGWPGGKTASEGSPGCWTKFCNQHGRCKCDEMCSHLKVVNEQLGIKLPNVITMETRGFWRERDESPKDGATQPYHYYLNAGTYFFQGQALAAGFLHLHDQNSSGDQFFEAWKALNEKAWKREILASSDLFPASIRP